MRLTRVFVDTALAPHASVDLPGETAAHIAKVLRARVGDAIVLFNGDGRDYPASIETIRGSRVGVAVSGVHSVDRESPLALTLVQSVSRGDRMDFVVQKATELGVNRIVPVLSARSVVRLNALQGASKLQHWRAVAISACEQCGRNRLPQIDSPVELLQYLGVASPPLLRLVLDPDGTDQPPELSAGNAIEVTIGPEGGFSAQEIDAMRLIGVQQIRLGPRILRTETAALAALTWLQTRFGDFTRASRPATATPRFLRQSSAPDDPGPESTAFR